MSKSELTLPEISPEFKPNYDFVKTREMHITDWFRTFFVTFALYRARQRIPKIDGFAETQRKIVWNALVNNYVSKEKSEDILSDVNKSSQYHHGIASKENVYNNLVAPYKNNLRFFKADGNFGFRYIQEAAAIRYTYSRNQKILKKIFHEEDIIATHSYRTTEGKPCEPETLYPILPIGIINGQNQIGVGFASTLLPRKVETILDLFIGILSGTVTNLPAYLAPEYPYYNGPTNIVDVNKWSLKGKVHVEVGKRGKKVIRITEVPPNWDKYTLINKDSTEFYYDINNNLISKNNTLFYRYNNRKITLEEFCTRTCENPFKITYNYNNENLLIEKYHQNLEFLLEKNRYDEKKNLIEKKLGKDSLGKSFQYFYDSKNRLTSRKEKEFNNNINKWLHYTETYFYNQKNMISKIIRKSNDEYLTTTTDYFYNAKNQLISKIYKTSTSIKGYQLNPKDKTVHSAYYGRIDYKYNSKNQLEEMIIYQPDYKTPIFKTIYSQKKYNL